ncbi:MAG: PPK2 family polyphosphate kinase [Chitinophagales bacterium]|nr:PPK2 family polyphosphate kinase [Chitinophagales bacterium]
MKLLTKISTRAPKGLQKEKIKAATLKLQKRLHELQSVMYAENKWSVLIVLQGLDAAGKDGSVKNVFSGVNPMGCKVKSFKKPTEEECAHDFLWRIHYHTPRQGMIQIFNRSHYEDVLVPRVHKWLSMHEIRKRFGYINSFEQLLQSSGTLIFKFYLHISKEEQQERFAERLTLAEKRWKYQDADLKESKHWDAYIEAFEDIFEHCSKEIPWSIVPADQNWYRNYIIVKAIVDSLEKLNMQYPDLQTKELP